MTSFSVIHKHFSHNKRRLSSVWKLQYVEARFPEELKWMSTHMNGVTREMFQTIFWDNTKIKLTDYWQLEDGTLDEFIEYFSQYWELKWGYVCGLENMSHLHYKLIDNVDKIYFHSGWQCTDELTSQALLLHFFTPAVQESIFGYEGHVFAARFDKNICHFSGEYNSLSNGISQMKKTLNNSIFTGITKIIFVYVSTVSTFGIIWFEKKRYWTAQVKTKQYFNKQEIYTKYWQENYQEYGDAINNACIKLNGEIISPIVKLISDYTYDKEDFFVVQSTTDKHNFVAECLQSKPVILQSIELFMHALNKTAKFHK